MSKREKPQNELLFGYKRQKTAIQRIAEYSKKAVEIVMEIGPPGTGKSRAAQTWKRCSPSGKFLQISCNQEANEGTFRPTISNLQHMIENLCFGSLIHLTIFLDEADMVCVHRKWETLEALQDVQRTMGLITTLKQMNAAILVLCTNCPTLIDQAISTQCDDVIYFPLPAADEIQDAFSYLNYPQEQANAIAKEWVADMQLHGWWSGRQIMPVILLHGGEVRNLNSVNAVSYLDKFVLGPRINDPRRYEFENSVWVDAGNRSLDRWAPDETA